MVNFLIVFVVVALLNGCASPISTAQKHELRAYEAEGIAVEEKSVGGAALLGLLPGGGSFYTRSYGWGVVNLLLWPYSILWDPISGVNGAEQINYYATRQGINVSKNIQRLPVKRKIEDDIIEENTQILTLMELNDMYSTSTMGEAGTMEKVSAHRGLLVARCKKCKSTVGYYPNMAGSKVKCSRCGEKRFFPN